MPGDCDEIRRALRRIVLPQDRAPGTFDGRALAVWRWIVDTIEYTADAKEQRLVDFWQFPAQTIVVRRGDREDCAFVLASLILVSGVTNHSVRVVLGTVTEAGGATVHHAWHFYKEESGRWCLLEATPPRGSVLDELPSAQSLASKHTGPPIYEPIFCINTEHVWQLGRRHDVEAFVANYAEQKRCRHKLHLKAAYGV